MVQKNKGITLIALVVTIIILLILAGITIATLTGENGLFARAKQAQTEYNLKLISKAQYYRDVYKMKDKEALKFAKQMNKEIIEETITDGIETAGDE